MRNAGAHGYTVPQQALDRTASRPGSQHVGTRLTARKTRMSGSRGGRCEPGRLAVRGARCSLGARKSCADSLVIGANQADIGSRKPPGCDRIARRHALPGSGGHQALAQDPLRAYPGAGPITPGGKLWSIRARTVPEAIAEQLRSEEHT